MTRQALHSPPTASGLPLPSALPRAAPRVRILGADAQRFSARVYDRIDALPDHWPRSGRTSAARAHVFQTVEFLTAWTETFGRATKARTCFVELRDGDGALAMLAPFVVTREAGARVLAFADGGAADYNAPVLFETQWSWTPRSAAAAWEAIKTALPGFDVALFDKMPAEVGGLVNPLHLLSTGENPESCHATNLRKPWAEVEKGQVFYGKRMRRIASLAETTPVRFEIAEDSAQRDRILAALLEQKQRRFEETKVPGFDAEPHKREFYIRATEAMAASGALHLSALVFGEDIVAAQWSLVHEKRYYALVGSFDPSAYSRYSPGKVLYLTLIKHLHEHGFEISDLGVGDEAYKQDHCDLTIRLTALAEPRNALGRLFLARAEALRRLRASAVWRRLRPLKWVLLRGLRRDAETKEAEKGA